MFDGVSHLYWLACYSFLEDNCLTNSLNLSDSLCHRHIARHYTCCNHYDLASHYNCFILPSKQELMEKFKSLEITSNKERKALTEQCEYLSVVWIAENLFITKTQQSHFMALLPETSRMCYGEANVRNLNKTADYRHHVYIVHTQIFKCVVFIRPSSDGTYYGMVMSVRPGLRPSVRPSQFSALFSYMLWDIKLKFCASLYFDARKIKFEYHQFP